MSDALKFLETVELNYSLLLKVVFLLFDCFQGLTFGEKVAYVYNPLEYATEPHEAFVRKFLNSTKSVLFLGMNPGPFGMAQNGVSG